MTTNPTQDLLSLLERQGPLSSGEIQKTMRVSQPTVSRMLASVKAHVVRIGKGRASRYARGREIAQVGHIIPVYLIDANGDPSRLANLRPLARDQYFVEWEGPARIPAWIAGASGSGLYDGLPYFLEGLRPGGFIGRQIGHNLAAQEGYPSDPRSWSDNLFLRYAVTQGYDTPGNIIVGAKALNHFLATQASPVRSRHQAYPHEVERIIKGGIPGSSADGEQPKFTAYTDQGHVIVKFSPNSSSADAIRWRDLLVAEHHALNALADAGINSADTRLIECGSRMFLESRRFDRIGERGRRPMFSLHAIDAEFSNLGNHWPDVINDLAKHNRVSPHTAEQVSLVHTYGKWIGNTDMHLGNLSFTVNDGTFQLLPIYDMLPMQLKPDLGVVVERPITAPPRTAENFQHWLTAGAIAAQFWARVADDALASTGFRKLARKQYEQTQSSYA